MELQSSMRHWSSGNPGKLSQMDELCCIFVYLSKEHPSCFKFMNCYLISIMAVLGKNLAWKFAVKAPYRVNSPSQVSTTCHYICFSYIHQLHLLLELERLLRGSASLSTKLFSLKWLCSSKESGRL